MAKWPMKRQIGEWRIGKKIKDDFNGKKIFGGKESCGAHVSVY